MTNLRSSSAHQKHSSLHARAFLWSSIVMGVGSILCILQATLSHTTLHGGTYTTDNQNAVPFDFPLKVPSGPAGDTTVNFQMDVHSIHASSYYILPDDCLQSLMINGQNVEASGVPFCDYVHGRDLALGQYLHPGTNDVRVVLKNSVGDLALDLHSSHGDIVFLLPYLIFFSALALTLFLLFNLYKPAVWVSGTYAMLLAGILFRLYYIITTPYWIRGHDTDAHIEYIRYIADHLSLPSPDLGWETWQPPLYYIVCALWMNLMRFVGFHDPQIFYHFEIFAFILSIVSLFAIAWVGYRILPKKILPLLPLFLVIPAFLPSLVFLSARINNDVLVTALECIAIALFFEWRLTLKLRWWVATWIVVSCAILTKNTALLLLPPLLLILLLERPLNSIQFWQRKIALTVMALLLVTVIAGWFTVYRKIEVASQNLIIGNTGTLNSGLILTNAPQNFLIFQPFHMIEHPYNSPWDDAERRQFFWEYLYRSAFTGEFGFEDARKYLVSNLLFFSLFVSVLALFGFIHSLFIKPLEVLPMALLGFFLLLGHLIFRMKFPYSSSQDFRYSLLFILPLSYFAVLGMSSIRSPLLQRCFLIAFEVSAALCVLLLF